MRTPLADLIQTPARAEREAIVKWLRQKAAIQRREHGDRNMELTLDWVADKIESGRHSQ